MNIFACLVTKHLTLLLISELMKPFARSNLSSISFAVAIVAMHCVLHPALWGESVLG